MDNVINLYENVSKDFKQRDKDQIEKFFASLRMADPESLKVLESYGIKLVKSSQLIVLTQDPKTLTQALDLAEKMGFIDAYKEEPKRLCQLVTNIIKRMAKCDAIGEVYKDEKGRFAPYLFSERAFNTHIASLGTEKTNIISISREVKPSVGDSKLDKAKEYALRVLEQFAIEDQKDAIFNRLDEIQNKGLGTKEMLIEAFKICAGNTELLSDTIDELLATETEMELAA